MKKFGIILLTVCMLTGLLTLSAFAKTKVDSAKDITYVADGSYMITAVTEQAVASSVRSTTYTKIGTAVTNYYNKDNELIFQHTLQGTFSVVEGVSATCTDVTYSYNIYDSSWKLDSASTWKDANIAYGSATFKDKVLFVTVNTVELSPRIVCDIYGNISH